MPRDAPVTSATLPSSGRSQSSGAAATASPTVTTWPDTYAERPESRKRSVDSTLPSAPGATRSSWPVPPVAQLLRRRAREALERALRDRGARVARPLSGGVREHDQAAARRELADVVVEEVVGGAQVLAARDPGGVEQERAEPVVLVGAVARAQPGVGGRAARVLVVDPRLGADRREHARDRLGQPPAGRRAEQRGRVQDGRAGLVAAQLDRVGKPEPAHHEAARARLGELLIAV